MDLISLELCVLKICIDDQIPSNFVRYHLTCTDPLKINRAKERYNELVQIMSSKSHYFYDGYVREFIVRITVLKGYELLQ